MKHKLRHANASVAVADFRQVEFHSFKAWDTTSPVTIYHFKFSAIFLVNNYQIMSFMNEFLCSVRLKKIHKADVWWTTGIFNTIYNSRNIKYKSIRDFECRQVTSTHLFTCRGWGLLFNPPTPPLLKLFSTFPLHWKLLATFYIVGKIVGFTHPSWNCLQLLTLHWKLLAAICMHLHYTNQQYVCSIIYL